MSLRPLAPAAELMLLPHLLITANVIAVLQTFNRSLMLILV